MSITLITILTWITGLNSLLTEEPHSSFRVTSLERERPIYYDTIGKVQLIHDEWRLLMYYNLTTYWNGIQELEQYLQDIETLCNKIDPRYCEPTIHQLSHEMENLKYYNDILLTPNKHLPGRNKRGLIDGVGYVANSLFGILDLSFVEQYNSDIQSIQTNEDYLLQLIKNQTSIVALENDVLKRNEENINQQFVKINSYMNQTDIRLASIESAIEIAMATSFLNSASLTAHLLQDSVKSIQETLYNTLVDIYKGHMNAHLLTPGNLIQQLTMISGRLPKTLTLPVENIQEDIKEIYKLLYVKARVTENYFMFEIHVPLASDDDYILYQIIPLPLKTNGDSSSVIISSKYIAVNLRKNTYASLNEKEISHCIQRNTNNFVCIINLPIFNLQSVNAPCEAKLLDHHTTSPCTIKKTICDADWIELHNTNTWLAVCCDSCTFRIVCDGNVRSVDISASSIVSVKQGCFIQTQQLTIYSHNNYYSEAKLDYKLQIPSLNKSINSIVSTHQTYQLTITAEKDLATIDKQLTDLENKENLPNNITTHDIHQYVITYLLLAALAVGIITWITKKRRCFPCQRTQAKIIKQQHQVEDVELQSVGQSAKRKRSQSLVTTEVHRATKDRPQTTTKEVSIPKSECSDGTTKKPRREPSDTTYHVNFSFED